MDAISVPAQSTAAAPAFDRIRHPKKRAFLAAFCRVACVSRAAELAECSRHSHYHWLKSDPDYAAAFGEAERMAADVLEDEAIRRAVYGIDEPVIHHGRVRQIFESYLEFESLLPTIAELDRRGWTTKRWTTKKGKQRGGRPFNKNTLYGLLTNVAYVGKVRYKDEVYDGEHEPIVDPETFEEVQRLLRTNHRTGGARVRNRFGALLKGLLRCAPCGCSMMHSHTTKDGSKRYRYYVCVNAQKRGWHNCPSRSIPAAEIEGFVVDQIRAVARDPEIVAATLAEASKQVGDSLASLETERRAVERNLARANSEMPSLAIETIDHDDSAAARRLADAQERIRLGEARLTEIREETIRLRAEAVSRDDIAAALGDFDTMWGALSPREQARVLGLLIERVEYDGDGGTVSVTFRPSGIKALAEETAA